MEYLPAELLLKIFKNLTYDDVYSIKQINRHFFDFINKYKDEFANKRFEQLCFSTSILMIKSIRLDLGLNCLNFTRPEWISAVKKRIPVYLKNTISISPVKTEPFRMFTKNDVKIIRYWLEQIFLCVFDNIDFTNFIFNPNMIKLLFNTDEIAKLQLKCRTAFLSLYHHQKIDWRFNFEHFSVGESLCLRFEILDDTRSNDLLLLLLLEEGNRIPEVNLFKPIWRESLCNRIIEHIEKSTDLSKIVPIITFDCVHWPISTLNIKGKLKKEYDVNIRYYELVNINNPKIKFSIRWNGNFYINHVKIIRINVLILKIRRLLTLITSCFSTFYTKEHVENQYK
ncbi:F-box domain-containing protein [Meloidogyne graminicola]|uniref:F-box domain-containing protein n=1 Tax=Meloidogyne graminicola TaxID=189291 RepID=A0A8S9ZUK3_9BILA|nr:F-box domain-containing protein [Meloidogyne graminicola]